MEIRLIYHRDYDTEGNPKPERLVSAFTTPVLAEAYVQSKPGGDPMAYGRREWRIAPLIVHDALDMALIAEKQEAKRAALAKLTPEEIVLLGLERTQQALEQKRGLQGIEQLQGIHQKKAEMENVLCSHG